MTIPVVQGTAVTADPSSYSQSAYVVASEDGNFQQPSGPDQHEKQTSFQDVPWAILFVAHLVAMMVVISMNLAGNGGQAADASYNGVIWMVGLTAAVAIALSSFSLGMMMKFPAGLIKVSLFVTVGMSLAAAIVGVMTGQMWFAISGILMFALGVCYARAVWPR